MDNTWIVEIYGGISLMNGTKLPLLVELNDEKSSRHTLIEPNESIIFADHAINIRVKFKEGWSTPAKIKDDVQVRIQMGCISPYLYIYVSVAYSSLSGAQTRWIIYGSIRKRF